MLVDVLYSEAAFAYSFNGFGGCTVIPSLKLVIYISEVVMDLVSFPKRKLY